MSLRVGRYETLGVIASGGMATVHLGRALGAGGFERLVAIKVMHPHIASEEDFVGMFLDEARLAARIRHPNVVGTIDVQQDESGLFLVMEYIEGPSLHAILRKALKEKRPVPHDVALRIVLDALAGLHAAHELKDAEGNPLRLVHRDVSPHNVLVGCDGIARITDFGVARAESRISTTRSGEIKGKLSYMAPEQIRSEPLDCRADVFAAGILLWELLANARLYQGENDGATVKNVLSGPARSPGEVQPGVPPAIAEACMRALRVDADERYPSAAAFADALEEAAARSGLAVASARGVGRYIREAQVFRSIRPPALSLAAAPAAGGSDSRSIPIPTAGSGRITGTPSATTSDPEVRRSFRGARAALAAGGAALLVGGAALLASTLRSPPRPEHAASAAPEASADSAPSVPSAAPPELREAEAASASATAAPTAEPGTSAATAAPTAEPGTSAATAAPTAEPGTSAAPPPTSTPSATSTAGPAAKAPASKPAKKPKKPAGTGTAFRPKEL